MKEFPNIHSSDHINFKIGNIDKDAKETIKVQGRGSSLWFTRKKDTTHVPDAKDNTEPETNRRTSGSWFSKQPIVEEPEEEELPIQQAPRRRPTRSATVSGFWPPRMNTKSEKEKELPQRPSHLKANSDSVIVRSKSKQKNDSTVVPRSQTENGEGKLAFHSFLTGRQVQLTHAITVQW